MAAVGDLRSDALVSALPDDPSGGKRLGDVVLTELLGRGGMGVVYKGVHSTMGVDVAVKVMSPVSGSASDEAAARFIREARLAAQIDHPNVIRVMNAGSSGPLRYIVMEYVEGASAEGLVEKHGPLPEREAAKIVLDAARGLRAAHEQCSLIHRDVKPANILVRSRDGRVKVADLGLAKAAGGGSGADNLTLSQSGMGTPPFMAPEQLRSARDVDHRADIYSLGATFCLRPAGTALQHVAWRGEKGWRGTQADRADRESGGGQDGLDLPRSVYSVAANVFGHSGAGRVCQFAPFE